MTPGRLAAIKWAANGDPNKNEKQNTLFPLITPPWNIKRYFLDWRLMVVFADVCVKYS